MLQRLRWHLRRLCIRIRQAGRCLVSGRRRKNPRPAIIFKRAPPPENDSANDLRPISTTIRIATFNAAFFALSSSQFYPPSAISALKPQREWPLLSSSSFFEIPTPQLCQSPPHPAATDKGKSLQREQNGISAPTFSVHGSGKPLHGSGKSPLSRTPACGSSAAFLDLSRDDLRRPPLSTSQRRARWTEPDSSASVPPLSAQAHRRVGYSASTTKHNSKAPQVSCGTSSSKALYGASPRSILNVLREADADLVALQQVKSEEADGMKPLSALARALGMHYAFAESWAPEFGNAVLSRWPIKSVDVAKLADESDWRNVLKVVVEIPFAGDLQFCCTHLDHLDEDWRLKQAIALTNSCKDAPHILAGDLNALDPSDYSGARWNDIAKLRASIGKNPPRHDVMRFLKQEQGYRDAKSHLAADVESVVVLPPGQGVPGTCKYGTRVDYILASPDLPFRFVPGSYTIVSSRGTSDHHLVRVEIEPATLK